MNSDDIIKLIKEIGFKYKGAFKYHFTNDNTLYVLIMIKHHHYIDFSYKNIDDDSIFENTLYGSCHNRDAYEKLFIALTTTFSGIIRKNKIDKIYTNKWYNIKSWF